MTRWHFARGLAAIFALAACDAEPDRAAWLTAMPTPAQLLAIPLLRMSLAGHALRPFAMR